MIEMDEELKLEIYNHYVTYKVLEKIFSKDINESLKDEFCKNQDFIDCLVALINYNFDQHIFEKGEKENIYTILSEFRYQESPLIDVNVYNDLISKLNTSTSENNITFLKCEFVARSIQPKYNIDNVDRLNFSVVKDMYQYDVNLLRIILASEEAYQENKEVLFLNGYYVRSIVGLLNNIPNVVKNDILLSRINEILATNKKLLKFDLYTNFIDTTNKDAIKLIKKIKKNNS